jgi:hypothetical protein
MMEADMYFLPEDELEITWMHKSTPQALVGHAWYKEMYCFFESEQQLDSEGKVPAVYRLYSLAGQALANELARERLFEMDRDPRFMKISRNLASTLDNRQTPDMQFIGRFVTIPVAQSKSGRGLQWAQDRIAGTIPQSLKWMLSRANLSVRE